MFSGSDPRSIFHYNSLLWVVSAVFSSFYTLNPSLPPILASSTQSLHQLSYFPSCPLFNLLLLTWLLLNLFPSSLHPNPASTSSAQRGYHSHSTYHLQQFLCIPSTWSQPLNLITSLTKMKTFTSLALFAAAAYAQQQDLGSLPECGVSEAGSPDPSLAFCYSGARQSTTLS